MIIKIADYEDKYTKLGIKHNEETVEIERLNDRCKRFEELVNRLRKERDQFEAEAKLHKSMLQLYQMN